jgi:cell division FtsZ-interacting protein ZapD
MVRYSGGAIMPLHAQNSDDRRSGLMADLMRAEELVQTMERDPAFQEEVEQAPTMTAKRNILDVHGFKDVSLDDMKAYVESQGGTLVVKRGDRDLSDEELDAVVGGLSSTDEIIIGSTTAVVIAGATLSAAAAAGA